MEPFDLNLLRVLTALDRTRSVTQAAEMLGMSQSGFSTALARLRRRFEDTLFVRTAAGMEPTPRARRMIDTAHGVMDSVQSGILEQPVFDPATTRTEFRFALTDVAEVVVMPRLIRHLQQVAPHAQVSCHALPPVALGPALEAGEVDAAVGYFPELVQQAYFKQRLYTHTFALMVRPDHPLHGEPMTPALFERLGHAVATSPSRSTHLFARFLEKRGIRRQVVLRTPHYLSLPAIIAESDLVATVPIAAGMSFARHGIVKLVRLPFDPPTFQVHQHWHRLVHHDERSRWLRAQVAMLCNDETDRWREVEVALYGQIRGRGRR